MYKISNLANLAGIAVMTLAQLSFAATDKYSWAEYVPGEFVVKMKDGNAMSALSNAGLEVTDIVNPKEELFLVKRNLNDSIQSLSVDAQISSAGLDRAIQDAMLASGQFEYVEPNYIYRTAEYSRNGSVDLHSIQRQLLSLDDAELPNDVRFPELWGMSNLGQNDSDGTVGLAGADIDALAAWETNRGSKDIVVAVIDTGVDYTHEDLVDNMWSAPHPDPEVGGIIHGYNAINDSYDPMDDNAHGTHCAGTIGGTGNNGLGVTGVAWNVSIMGVKFLSASGGGTLADAVKAIDFATEREVDIMSNSWGGGGFSQAMFDSITRANEKGIVFVAAAGNSRADNDQRPAYPATYDVENVVSVAATTNVDSLASFSSYGKNTVHLGAPGHNIVSSTPGNSYESFSGTSMATPHVSGAVAVLLAGRGADMTPVQVRDQLIFSSERLAGLKGKVRHGGSRLNLYNLVNGIEIPGPIIVPPDSWSSLLPLAIESERPYKDKTKVEWELEHEGGKFLKIHFAEFNTENRYDVLEILDGETGAVLQSYSGDRGEFWTEQIDSAKIKIRFTSDSSVTKDGFRIDGYSWSDYERSDEGESI